MISKMSMLRSKEDSLVGYNKRVANYTDEYDSEDEYDYEDEDNFYDQYETYEEEFDNYDYEPPLNPLDEEKDKPTSFSKNFFRKINPYFLKKLNSPTKSAEKSPPKCPTWWDKNKTITESERIVNGVLNYAALLPLSTPKVEAKIPPSKKTKKNKKTPKETVKQEISMEPKNHKKQPILTTEIITEVQKPTRLCLSVIKKSKCFHGTQCRFAHDYSDLKECNFGEKCKKVLVVKTNPNGTRELSNKTEVGCTFKHPKESKASYLKRVTQHHTSPKK
jgi:hypothetical protein